LNSLGSRKVGRGEPALLVAEVGSNHNRDMGITRKLIDACAEAKWDAVKFQLFSAAELYPPNCGVVDTPTGPADFFKVLEAAELPAGWLPEIKDYAESAGLMFLCTPFDLAAVDTLERLRPAGYKIASPELNHLPLLRKVAATGRTMICSTGLCTLADIEEALATIRAVPAHGAVMLLQCVTAYPTPIEQSNLAVIETLERAFGVPVGYSDHTIDFERVPAVAVAAGAALIEKHVTLDRSLAGPDHSFAIIPGEMRRMAEAVRAIETLDPGNRIAHVRQRYGESLVSQIMGHGRKEIMPAEAALYPCDKRSIHALRAIAAGETLTSQNVRILRSERNLAPGLHPRHFAEILGKETTRGISLGEGLRWEHLLQ
jgi:N,N'-diacetyllegionaminate synthase